MAEAKLNREYALRISGVGVLLVGMCLWSLYDGIVAWPRQNAVMEQVRPVLLATNLTAEAWNEYAETVRSPLREAFHAKGLAAPSKLIKKLSELELPKSDSANVRLREAQAKQIRKLFEGPVYSEHDLSSQFVQAAVTLALGVLAMVSLARKRGKRFIAGERALSGSGFNGAAIAYGDIARIDWSKWDDKGIVTLTLASGQRVKLDGWHFAGMTDVVAEIQKRRPDLNPRTKAGSDAERA